MITKEQRAYKRRWYNAPYVQVDVKTPLEKIPPVIKDIADRLYPEVCERPNGMVDDTYQRKRQFFWRLIWSAFKAIRKRGCIQIFRTRKLPLGRANLGVIDRAVAAGVFYEIRTETHAPKSSRLVPQDKVTNLLINVKVPLYYDVVTRKQRYIKVKKYRNRNGDIKTANLKKKRGEPVNPKHPVVREVTKLLQQEYESNSHYLCYFPAGDMLEQFWVQHIAKYTDNYKLGGRFWSKKGGHQQVPKDKRKEIWIKGDEYYYERGACEYDFSALYISMLYNWEGLETPRNPYALWDDMDEGLLLAGKKMTNFVLNTAERGDALNAFWKLICGMQKGYKVTRQGNKLKTALKVASAMARRRIRPLDIYNAVWNKHPQVRHRFHEKDLGLRLMNVEAKISADVISYFATKGWLIMNIHDSFICETDKGAAHAK